MRVVIHFHPDGQRREIDIEPGGRFGYLVSPDPERPEHHRQDMNEHTLAWTLNRFYAACAQSPDPHQASRCEREFGWVCPLHPWHPCMMRGPWQADQRKACVTIESSAYEPVLVPVGQMTLDRPTVSHQRQWRNIWTGELVDSAERPFHAIETVCKEMAVASLKAIQRGKREWETPSTDSRVKWRIRPLTDRHIDLKWLSDQQADFAGRVKPCVFESGIL